MGSRFNIIWSTSNIESYSANEERLSYEIWHYDDSDSGYLFIFINKEEGVEILNKFIQTIQMNSVSMERYDY